MNVRHILLAVCAMALLALAAPFVAFAQSPDRIASLAIAVWPEFDDPRVLVQFDGTLVAQDSYPRELSFYVPATASLLATAYKDETQQYLNTDPATTTDMGNGWKRVTFKTPKPNFHLEYYHDAIKGAPDKQFEFVYNALLPADSMQIQVQQPLKSENFKTTPASALISEGMHGFKYHLFNYPGIAANQEYKLQVGYTKTDPNPSMQNVAPPQTAPQANPADVAVQANPQQLVLIVGIGVAVALGILALWFWYTRRQPRLAFAGSGGSSTSSRKAERVNGFCSQCGSGLHAGDNFCPRCGAKRK